MVLFHLPFMPDYFDASDAKMFPYLMPAARFLRHAMAAKKTHKLQWFSHFRIDKSR